MVLKEIFRKSEYFADVFHTVYFQERRILFSTKKMLELGMTYEQIERGLGVKKIFM